MAKPLLVVGGCPSCIRSAQGILRRLGYNHPQDYHIQYTVELKGDIIFEKKPELNKYVSAFIYNKEAGLFIDMRHLQLTQEIRHNIDKLFNS